MLRACDMLRRAGAARGRAWAVHARLVSSAAERVVTEAFRAHGHREARLDPLGLAHPERCPELGEAIAAEAAEVGDEAMARLRSVYCGSVGAEFSHVESLEERDWIAREMESTGGAAPTLTPAEASNAHMLMTMALEYELFMQRKFTSFKRYSGEGAEGVLPGVFAMLHDLARGGVTDAVVGMNHRGRLGLMLSVLDFPAQRLFAKVLGHSEFPADWGLADDVSSHLFHSVRKSFAGSPPLDVSLLPNPSHLEAVDPVVAGKARAKQKRGRNAVPVLLHGDAAFAGQGVVYEACGMANLPGFTAGGTLHVVTNNQLGFTATQREGRSSRYCTDVAKGIGAPVFHVNAEDVPAVVRACRLAAAFRTRFGKDAFVDVVCYRRHGHNEVDEPAFTQPAMYGAIRARGSPVEAFRAALIRDGVLTEAKVDQLRSKLVSHLEQSLEAARGGERGDDPVSAFQGAWAGHRLATPADMHAQPVTGVPVSRVEKAVSASVRLPEGFSPHRRLERSHIKARLAALGDSGGEGSVDWATAEAAAFGTLLQEGTAVRLSGQDAERGTFSHRHAVLHDQHSGERHSPLAEYARRLRGGGEGSWFEAHSSHLSEMAVLGFEYGHALDDPRQLVLWEAQFGDFANGAQVIVDQFVSGGESKWARQAGLVMLLPHGQDGAGPEHSSGRLERFLQLSDDAAPACDASAAWRSTASTNMIVANLTTAAQYFHFLRRQIVRPFRKPAVLMAPKQLLRLPQAESRIEELGEGTTFQPVLEEPEGRAPVPADRVHRVLLCSGKTYYDLAAARDAAKGEADRATAIIRVEVRGSGAGGSAKRCPPPPLLSHFPFPPLPPSLYSASSHPPTPGCCAGVVALPHRGGGGCARPLRRCGARGVGAGGAAERGGVVVRGASPAAGGRSCGVRGPARAGHARLGRVLPAQGAAGG